jgi:hypothetical protein
MTQRRKDVYVFGNNGNALRHFNTVTDAKDELGISNNTIANALDKKYTVNGMIFRSANVIFKDYELDEINRIQKNSKKHLSKEQHLEIQNLYKNGQTKQNLMKMFSISKTQINRITSK